MDDLRKELGTKFEKQVDEKIQKSENTQEKKFDKMKKNYDELDQKLTNLENKIPEVEKAAQE